VSSPYIDDHMQAVEKILGNLGLDDIPQLLVFNKMDLVGPEVAANLARLHQGIAISAHERQTLPPLIERLQQTIVALGYEPMRLDATESAATLAGS
jgi:GTPase